MVASGFYCHLVPKVTFTNCHLLVYLSFISFPIHFIGFCFSLSAGLVVVVEKNYLQTTANGLVRRHGLGVKYKLWARNKVQTGQKNYKLIIWASSHRISLRTQTYFRLSFLTARNMSALQASIVYLVCVSYPVCSPWSTVRSPCFVLTSSENKLIKTCQV